MSSAPKLKIECPATYMHRDEDKKRFVTRQELADNGGVCASCREKFKRRNKSQISRRHETEHHDFATMNHGGQVAFVGDHVEPIVEPAVDFIIEDGEVVATGLDSIAVRAIAKFCARLFEIGGRNKEKFFQAAHAFCFAAHTHPEQHLSGEVIAEKFHITKAAFFKQVNRYRDILGLARIAGAKSNDARKVYRKRMKESHEQRKKKRQQTTEATQANGAFARHFSEAIDRARRTN